jgi:hypothetical protein
VAGGSVGGGSSGSVVVVDVAAGVGSVLVVDTSVVEVVDVVVVVGMVVGAVEVAGVVRSSDGNDLTASAPKTITATTDTATTFRRWRRQRHDQSWRSV